MTFLEQDTPPQRPVVTSEQPRTGLSSTFHGRPVAETRKVEQPWHRAAAALFASGHSSKEVAELCERTPATINLILKNAWFQDLVTEEISKRGGDALEALIKGEGINSLAELIKLRDSNETPASVKNDICKNLLDRIMGKPVTRVEADTTVRSGDPVSEIEELERRNALLLKQLSQ